MKNVKEAFLVSLFMTIVSILCVGVLDLPRVDYSDVDPFIYFASQVFSFSFVGWLFVSGFFGGYLYANTKILEMENKKEED